MVTLLKWIGVTAIVLIVAIALFLFGMRFHDGPIEIISGGPFKTGEPAPVPGNWDFIKGRATIEFQTMDPATSRTVWLAVHDGRLFVVSGYMTTPWGKVWKHWPHYLEEDDRVLLRIDRKIFHQRLERITDGPLIEPVTSIFESKYGVTNLVELVEINDFWIYEVKPR